jgi:hypothetical protein
MESKKEQIVNEIVDKLNSQQELLEMKFEFNDQPQSPPTDGPKKRGRKPGSHNYPKTDIDIRDVRVHHILHLDNYGTPCFVRHEVEIPKPKSFVVRFKLSCGADYIDGFNTPISKRIGNINYLKTKTPNNPGICMHLNNCPGCYIMKTFDVIKSYEGPQPMAILRNEVTKYVEQEKKGNPYRSLINN